MEKIVSQEMRQYTRRFPDANGLRSRYWIFPALAIGAYLALVLLVGYLNSRLGLLPTLCPLKFITGIPCPFCGGTRAALALLQGDFHRAIIMNPLSTALVFLAPPAALLYYRIIRPRGGTTRMPKCIAVILLIVIIAANWLYLIRAGR